MRNVLAIIVTYHPELVHLNKLINVLLKQVEGLLIIDNNTPDFRVCTIDELSPKLEVILNPDNVGLATAYNQGYFTAKTRGYSHIILFDQDSMPADNMIANLYSAITDRNDPVFTVAAAGPKYTDIKGQKLSPFVRIKDFHLERIDCSESEVVEVDHLISSGSLIDLRALDRVGNFVDGLFIDCVDTEWCLRVRHHGLKIVGVGNALMTHNIGDRYLNVLGRQLPFHTPLRLRYQFRNQVWIIKQFWVGWRWRIIDSIRCIKLIAVYVIFAPNKFNNLTAITKGIIDGIINRMGKI
jgi:rhamnosyltransferase